MASFDTFIKTFNPGSNDKGKQFEHFVKSFLKVEQYWSTQVGRIWLWDEWPGRWGADDGIDLIFKHKITGEIWAVQAKNYGPEFYISKPDIDSFLSESNGPEIHQRLLIGTTNHIGPKPRRVMKRQDKPVTLFLLSDFQNAAINYPETYSDLTVNNRKEKHKAKEHQKEAIKDVVKGFSNADRGQLIMACGTGKTYTTLWIKERLNSNLTLVLVPSLQLLSQTLSEWTFMSKSSLKMLCVCSDRTVYKKGYDHFKEDLQDVFFPATTDFKAVQDFLKLDGDKIIFSTYHSSPVIAEAQKNQNIPSFDLVIADEAHRCTGVKDKVFTTVLSENEIRSTKRLFTTATPKIYKTFIKKRAKEKGLEIADMSDEKSFGKVFHSLSFYEAIKIGELTDYQVVIIGIDDPMIARFIEQRELIKTEYSEINSDAKFLAAQIGVLKAISDFDIKRMISFHSFIPYATDFSEAIQSTLKIINKAERPSGKIWSDVVSSKMRTDERKAKLAQLKDLYQADIGILSNARCLAEGIDLPSLDAVAFIDPKGSEIDIIQATGRAIRLSPNKTKGTIVLPVFIRPNEDAEHSIESSNFKPIWDVINALKSHDDDLVVELEEFRTELGRTGKRRIGSPSIRIHIDLPKTVDSSFAEALNIYLVEKTTHPWSFWFGLLLAYVDREGNANVPYAHKENNYRLGDWVNQQRNPKNKALLTNEQLTKLEELPGWEWDAREALWDYNFELLLKYVEIYKTPNVSRNDQVDSNGEKTKKGETLGFWVGFQRQNYRKEILRQDRIDRLESIPGWTWDAIEALWLMKFEVLKQYCEKYNKIPEQSIVTDDGVYIGRWVSFQRSQYKKNNLDVQKIKSLESLELWTWTSLITNSFDYGYQQFKIHCTKFKTVEVKQNYIDDDEFHLGRWVACQRRAEKNYTLSKERKAKLDKLGFLWDSRNIKEDLTWMSNFHQLKDFFHKHSRLPTTKENRPLHSWAYRQVRNRSKLSSKRIKLLESIKEWKWKNKKEIDWDNGYQKLKEYFSKYDDRWVTQLIIFNDFKLGSWVSEQRRMKRNGRLTRDRIVKLNELGLIWEK